MKYLKLSSLTTIQKEEILQLWNNEYPTTLKHETLENFDEYLASLIVKQHIIIEGEDGKIKAWCCIFQRNGETWLAMILDYSIQNRGFGSKLLSKVKEEFHTFYGWIITTTGYFKQNGDAYQSPLQFYRKNGFTIHYDIKLETDKIKAIKISWEK